jgi:hypothetical protein
MWALDRSSGAESFSSRYWEYDCNYSVFVDVSCEMAGIFPC